MIRYGVSYVFVFKDSEIIEEDIDDIFEKGEKKVCSFYVFFQIMLQLKIFVDYI